MTRIIAAAVLVACVAGCGSTRTVTRTVHVKPCQSAAAMSECVRLLVDEYRGGASVTVHTRCKPSAVHGQWSCVVLVDDAVLGSNCGRITAEMLGPGVLFPAGDDVVPGAVCDRTFGKA